MNETLGSQERIKKADSFKELYRKGKRLRGQYLVFIYLASSLNHSRMSVVVGKRHGTAAARNKIKRRIRTLYRRNKELIIDPVDMLIIPLRDIQSASWAALERDYIQGIRSISGAK